MAPTLAHLHFPIPERGWFFGQAFYFFPLGKNRCRILTRSYRNFVTWQVKLTPRWQIHLRQNKILAEDLSQLLGQQQEVERLGKNIKEIYTVLPTCDTFAIAYRQWLDQFGAALPFYRGYTTSKGSKVEECHSSLAKIEHSFKHTELCASCNQAYQVTKQLKQTFVGIAIALAALAIVTDGSWLQIATVSAFLSAVIGAFVAQKLQADFECY